MAPRTSCLLALAGALILLAAPPASAGATPHIGATFVTEVTATSARLRAEINPEGEATFYHFDYIAQTTYEENVKAAKEGFLGAARVPLAGSVNIGAGSSDVTVAQHIGGLLPETRYRYRAVATNSSGTTTGPERSFGTEAATNLFSLPDNRGWELVSPAEKNGGAIQPPETILGGGAFQAASNGQYLTYSSADSFGKAQSSPAASQYIAGRIPAGWSSENITTPMLSGGYGEQPQGVPYRLFSTDLSRALLSNGQRCRGEVGECPVANPPLPGTGAPAGYRNYYLRGGGGGFESLLGSVDLAHTSLGPEQFEVSLAGATPDLTHVLLSSCAALTADATEVPAPGGCDPEEQNLYEWSSAGLVLTNLLPGNAQGTPGALLAAPTGAISDDGSRIYWSEGGDLFLREGTQTKQADEGQGGGGKFQTASADGRYAFFTKSAHLFRYDATSEGATDLTPAGGVQGVLGASADGSKAYYLSAAGLYLWSAGTTTKVAAAAAASDYPPATGTARVSPDGTHLLFLSAAELTGYENNGQMEVFLYGPIPAGGPAALSCVSCNPTGERPRGQSSIPGAVANGQGPAATRAYKPRALSVGGGRVFFESFDRLAIADTNSTQDVYEWEARGVGSCTREGGCTSLISSGRSPAPSVFLDASVDGSDVFFLTDSSLAFGDPGSSDVYDARVGGGFPVPPNTIACEGDACQSLPEAPEDPTPGTLVPNSGNPQRHFSKAREKKHKGLRLHHRRHHKKHKKHQKHGGGR